MKRLVSAELTKLQVSGINFVNGFLDDDLQLRAHDPDFGMTYCLPYPYEVSLAGKTPMWLGMLNRAWGGDVDYAEKVEALQQAIGVTLFGKAPSINRVFCLYGVGNSGKTQILEVVKGLMPDGCYSAIPPHRWHHEYDLSELAGKLLNVAGELSEQQKINGEVFKKVTEGSMVSARRIYQPVFSFYPKAAHWFATNHLPRTADSSDGFTRRWLIFTFKRAVQKAGGDFKTIPDYYQEVLYNERAAIAAWAVQGYSTFKAQGAYTLPSSHEEQVSLVANQANSVLFFLKCLRQRGQLLLGASEHEGKSSITTAIDPLYVDYRSFCIAEASVSPVDSQAFLSRLDALAADYGFQVQREDPNGVLVHTLSYFTHVVRKVA
jgi:P4 family phage/plasmid primase-like protien